MNAQNSRKMSAKILLIEDDEWLAESFLRTLKSEFTEVKIINDPNFAFEVFAKFWPDLIVADVLLGAQNLFVLLNEMASYDDSRKIPIVILSSVAEQIQLKNVREFGVRKVLDKAKITPKSLRAEVEKVLENSRKSAENLDENFAKNTKNGNEK